MEQTIIKGKVGIALVNYNGEQYIVDCIESLLAQTYKNIEIIFWDNNSEDNSVKIIQEKFPEIKIIKSKDNCGFAKANNIVVKKLLASGVEYILLLNVDTVSDCLLIDALIEEADSKTVATGRISKDQNDKIVWYGGGELQLEMGKSVHINRGARTARQVSFISGCCMMIHRDIVLKYGLFNLAYYLYFEDTDLCTRWYLNGIEMFYTPKAKLWHKVGGSLGSENNPVKVYYMTRNRLFYIQRYKKEIKVKKMLVLKQILKDIEWHCVKGEWKMVKAISLGVIDYYMKKMGKLNHKI